MYAPLSMIAAWNRPCAVVVEARLDVTLRPPADSPPMVTFLGSPPKRAPTPDPMQRIPPRRAAQLGDIGDISS